MAGLTDASDRTAVLVYVDGDVVVVNAFSRRVDAGEKSELPARLVRAALARAGAAVPAIVVALGSVLWNKRHAHSPTPGGVCDVFRSPHGMRGKSNDGRRSTTGRARIRKSGVVWFMLAAAPTVVMSASSPQGAEKTAR